MTKPPTDNSRLAINFSRVHPDQLLLAGYLRGTGKARGMILDAVKSFHYPLALSASGTRSKLALELALSESVEGLNAQIKLLTEHFRTVEGIELPSKDCLNLDNPLMVEDEELNEIFGDNKESADTRRNNVLHFVDGGCNAGKSLFSSMLIEYYLDRKRKYHLLDLDVQNPDVRQRYSTLENTLPDISATNFFCSGDNFPVFEEDLICNSAPATSEDIAPVYILDCQKHITCVRWFVCDSSLKSIDLYKRLLSDDIYEGEKLVYVHNEFWGRELPKHFSDFLSSRNVTIIKLPSIKFTYRDIDMIDKNLGIPYSMMSFQQKGKYNLYGRMQEIFPIFDSFMSMLDKLPLFMNEAS